MSFRPTRLALGPTLPAIVVAPAGPASACQSDLIYGRWPKSTCLDIFDDRYKPSDWLFVVGCLCAQPATKPVVVVLLRFLIACG